MKDTPVLLIAFNRPQLLQRIIDLVGIWQPYRLYLSVDGPRIGKEGEADKVDQVKAFAQNINWPCEVFVNFYHENQGCRLGVSGALNWFFQHEEFGIILEDDCLVDETFYEFATELLIKFKNNTNIMSIGASNFQQNQYRGDGSYYFSAFNHIWGWATWRRAWQHYDLTMERIDNKTFLNAIKKMFDRTADIKFWLAMFNYIKSGNLDTWDFQWQFSVWAQGGLAIVPQVNMVNNLGFGIESTNTTGQADDFLNPPCYPMAFPLRHPPKLERHKEADLFTADNLFKVSKSAKTGHLKIKLAAMIPHHMRHKLKTILKR